MPKFYLFYGENNYWKCINTETYWNVLRLVSFITTQDELYSLNAVGDCSLYGFGRQYWSSLLLPEWCKWALYAHTYMSTIAWVCSSCSDLLGADDFASAWRSTRTWRPPISKCRVAMVTLQDKLVYCTKRLNYENSCCGAGQTQTHSQLPEAFRVCWLKCFDLVPCAF